MANTLVTQTISPANQGGYDRSGTYYGPSGDDLTALGGTPSEIEFFAFSSSAIQAAISSVGAVTSVQLHFTTYTSDVIPHTITVTGNYYDLLTQQTIDADQSNNSGFNDQPGEFAHVFQDLQSNYRNNGFSASIPITAYGKNDSTAQTYDVAGKTQNNMGGFEVTFVAQETSGGVSDIRNAYITVSGIVTSNNPTVSNTQSDQAVAATALTVTPFSTVTLTDPGNPTAANDEIQISVLETITDASGKQTQQSTDAAGTLTGAGLSASDGYGDYTLAYNSIANLQSQLRALVFHPARNTGTAPLHVTFELDVQSGAGGATDNQNTSIDIAPVCFAEGTLIRTPAGSRPVESLQPGDLVLCASGAARPVRWTGHRRLDCRRHPDPAAVMPVRIAAHAFGPAMPDRDLFVSPGHALCPPGAEDVLIPAQALCNGATVRQVDVDRVTYWHVELDAHDVLLAENLPAESYMDVGNRHFFAGTGPVTLHGVPDAAPNSLADYCRPFAVEGPAVEAARALLHRRAGALGWTLAAAPDAVCLVVDGVTVAPAVDGTILRFPLPRGGAGAWLVSGAACPRDVSDSADRRNLGLDLLEITVEHAGGARAVALDDPLLCAGLHAVERGTGPAHRWTTGRALLPAALWAGCEAPVLRVQLASPAMPGWREPEVECALAA